MAVAAVQSQPRPNTISPARSTSRLQSTVLIVSWWLTPVFKDASSLSWGPRREAQHRTRLRGPQGAEELCVGSGSPLPETNPGQMRRPELRKRACLRVGHEVRERPSGQSQDRGKLGTRPRVSGVGGPVVTLRLEDLAEVPKATETQEFGPLYSLTGSVLPACSPLGTCPQLVSRVGGRAPLTGSECMAPVVLFTPSRDQREQHLGLGDTMARNTWPLGFQSSLCCLLVK